MTDQDIACDLTVFDPAESARHADLSARLLAGGIEREQLPDGVALRLTGTPGLLTELAEWAELERRCCPFLSFTLRLDPGPDEVRLELRGPAGAKEMLQAIAERE